MVGAKRLTLLAALATAAVALGAAAAGAAHVRMAEPAKAASTGNDLVQRVHWKRTHRKRGTKKLVPAKRRHKARRYNKNGAKNYTHAKKWHSSATYGVTYVRPKPYAYIYRYQPYVYHRPRVFIRPIPRAAHRHRYWPRKTWRKRYDRRPGVYYHHR